MGATYSSTHAQDSESSSILSFKSAEKWRSYRASVKDSTQLMVIDFSASWCGPCRFMDPIMKEFAAQFKEVIFVKLDIDELVDVAKEWNVEVMPTFVFVKKGIEVDRVLGAKKDILKKKIEDYMID